MTNKKQFHSEIIKAWADGLPIQYRWGNDGVCRDAVDPRWIPACQYRVKPKEKNYKNYNLYLYKISMYCFMDH